MEINNPVQFNRKDDKLIWRDTPCKGFLIIPNHDLHAGFGALLIYALNGIRKAESIDFIPVIDFDRSNTPYFYDPGKGESVWEYYFEKVSPYKRSDVLSLLDQGLITGDQIRQLSSEESAHTHQHDPNRIATFWAWEEPQDKAKWIREKRALGSDYVKKYIKVKQDVVDRVDDYVDRLFANSFTIGVHIRGTDFAYANPTPVEAYFEEIDELLKTQDISNCHIFVATDQVQFLEVFKERYGSMVVNTDSFRSNNHLAPFRYENKDGYQLGKDVLIDILLLAKCNHLIKGAAAIGELASWFGQNRKITDFALKSGFVPKPYDQLETAFLKLNIDSKSQLLLKLHRYRSKFSRRIQNSRLGRKLFQKFRFVRVLFGH